jgi:hydroxysqualene dehydroxylase
MPKHVAVVGGGLSGLAAACILASRGISVSLFEAGNHLGGRARSVNYKDVKLDNGQHILLGAYKETLALLKLAGVHESKAMIRLPLQLSMLDLSKKSRFSFKACSALPAPLHILAGLLFAKGASLTERLSAIKLMVWIKVNHFKLLQDEPLAGFLQRKNQSETLIKNLWEPICLAALNTPLALASTQIFLNVLRDSFANKKTDSDLLLPKVDLGALLAEPLANYIQQYGGEVKTNCVIKSITPVETGFLLNDERTFSHAIIACAPHQLSHLSINLPNFSEHFHYQPITTIYLQYAENTKLPQAMTGLVGSLAQWVFDKGILCNQNGLMAVVISAHAPFDIPQEALAARIAEELKNTFPQLDKPLWHKVITEKRATFSCHVNLLRPASSTLYPNLFIAGDYTYADYPATIEGAVRSGINVSNCIINS